MNKEHEDKRLLLSGLAMMGIMASAGKFSSPKAAAELAASMADALIKELEVKS